MWYVRGAEARRAGGDEQEQSLQPGFRTVNSRIVTTSAVYREIQLLGNVSTSPPDTSLHAHIPALLFVNALLSTVPEDCRLPR